MALNLDSYRNKDFKCFPIMENRDGMKYALMYHPKNLQKKTKTFKIQHHEKEISEKWSQCHGIKPKCCMVTTNSNDFFIIN